MRRSLGTLAICFILLLTTLAVPGAQPALRASAADKSAPGGEQAFDDIAPTLVDVTAAAFPNGAPELAAGTTDWVDYDNDGDLDLFLTGVSPGNDRYSLLERNDGGVFADVTDSAFPNAILPNVGFSVAAWADFNNDGKLDLFLIGGDNVGNYYSHLYRNGGTTFSDITASAFANGNRPTLTEAAARWGDYDNDGLPDLLMFGLIPNTTDATVRL